MEKNNKVKEIRTICHEVRASPDEGKSLHFDGYAAIFDIWSEDLGGYREKIAQGAFKNALARGDDVRVLFNHDPNYVLGRTSAGTARLSEDEKGLRFEVDAPDAAWARDLRESVRRGDINQCSFAFYLKEESWKQGTDGQLDERTIMDVELVDVSIVTYPAYKATSASARSRETEKPAWRREIARRRLKLRIVEPSV